MARSTASAATSTRRRSPPTATAVPRPRAATTHALSAATVAITPGAASSAAGDTESPVDARRMARHEVEPAVAKAVLLAQ